uniref:Uncharacterized protein n=1 Tax=Euplotes crassus TaxID=5936 RepID=A0A7S3KIJ3_EUPCR
MLGMGINRFGSETNRRYKKNPGVLSRIEQMGEIYKQGSSNFLSHVSMVLKGSSKLKSSPSISRESPKKTFCRRSKMESIRKLIKNHPYKVKLRKARKEK